MISSRCIHALDILLPIFGRPGIIPYRWNKTTHRLEHPKQILLFHANVFLFLIWFIFIIYQVTQPRSRSFDEFNLIPAFSIVDTIPFTVVIMVVVCKRELLCHINGFFEHCAFIKSI